MLYYRKKYFPMKFDTKYKKKLNENLKEIFLWKIDHFIYILLKSDFQNRLIIDIRIYMYKKKIQM